MKFLKGHKTRLLGASIAILGLFEQYIREIMPDEYQGIAYFVIGSLIIILRQVTTTPPGKKL